MIENNAQRVPFSVKKPSFNRPKMCPLSKLKPWELDYKNVKLLGKMLSEMGKINPRRLSATTSKKQRELAKAIKIARFMGLLPYVSRES